MLRLDFSSFFCLLGHALLKSVVHKLAARATTETDGWNPPILVFIVYELHCAHIPYINLVYCYRLGAVVEQENMRIFALSMLGIYSGGNHCPATLCKRLHYRVIHLEIIGAN